MKAGLNMPWEFEKEKEDGLNKEKIRTINNEERRDLEEYFRCVRGYSEAEAKNTLDRYLFITIEDYISECPGYQGRLIFAVYSYPSFHDMFVYRDDGIERVKSERESQLENEV